MKTLTKAQIDEIRKEHRDWEGDFSSMPDWGANQSHLAHLHRGMLLKYIKQLHSTSGMD